MSLHTSLSATIPVHPNVAPHNPLHHSQCTSNCRYTNPSQPLALYIQLSHHTFLSASLHVHPTVAPKLLLTHSPYISNSPPQLAFSQTPCCKSKFHSKIPCQTIALHIQMSLKNSLSANRPALHSIVPPQIPLNHSPCCTSKFPPQFPVSHSPSTSKGPYTIPSQPLAML